MQRYNKKSKACTFLNINSISLLLLIEIECIMSVLNKTIKLFHYDRPGMVSYIGPSGKGCNNFLTSRFG